MPAEMLANSGEPRRGFWTNRSVLALSQGADPVDVIVAKARSLTFEAFESGWSGPPYDPFALAELMKIEVLPSEDVADARTVPAVGGKLRIEFNPNRSPGRINYSIAHELGHALFPDCAEGVRNRTKHTGATRDEWQLEMLCNIAAAEILMPVGSLRSEDLEPSVDRLLQMRKDYAVSSEAILLRIIRLTTKPCLAILARRDPDSPAGRYRADYAVGSRAWSSPVANGFALPLDTVLSECTAIGFTAKATENWFRTAADWKIEALGIPPYPGHVYPRVIGIAKPVSDRETEVAKITYLKGDATAPRGSDYRILAQVVNDKSIVWGAGFARAVRKKWPKVQGEFAQWVVSGRGEFKLGNTHISAVDDSIALASLVAQHGFGPSATPRIRYSALEMCLDRLGDYAVSRHADVHMPRIGSGEAGGSWEIVSEIIEETLCRRGVRVTVYDLPNAKGKQAPKQLALSIGPEITA
jgi:hypothetical protein